MTQNNLGNALRILGERGAGISYLEEALDAYVATLTVYDRQREPADWAMSQSNLGTTLWKLGELESGTVRLDEARTAIELAWQGYREGGMPGYDAWFEDRLKTLDEAIASRAG
jgi:hypothetical protein